METYYDDPQSILTGHCSNTVSYECYLYSTHTSALTFGLDFQSPDTNGFMNDLFCYV